MKKCPSCSAEVQAAEDQFCRSCGFDLTINSDETLSTIGEQTDPDFTVTETACGSTDLVGSESDQDGVSEPGSGGEQNEPGDYTSHDEVVPASDPENHPIGSSAPPPPPDVDSPRGPEIFADAPASFSSPAGSKRAFPEGDASSRDNGNYVTASEKEELMRKLNQSQQKTESAPESGPTEPERQEKKEPTSAATSSDPLPDDGLPHPRMASRGKGVAFYYRNLIQLAGHPEMTRDDVLLVNDREYELRPKRINSRILIGSAATAAAIILIFIASLFVGDASTGQGQIIGVVLDDLNQPYLGRSTVTLADVGKSFTPNTQGFFRCAGIPTGTHEVQYFVGGELVGTEYATVVDAEVTTLLLRPAPMAQENTTPEDVPQSSEVLGAPGTTSKNQTRGTASANKSKSQRANSRWAKLALSANVKDARLTVDGEVLGAGNLTYAKLLPGDHRYVISREGYEDAKGTFTLKGGKTTTLTVTLEPSAPVEVTYSAEDFYYSGLQLAEDSDFEGAIAEYSESIGMNSSYAEAFLARAAAHTKLKSMVTAYGDYRQAAEIYRARGDYNRAITAYNKAIDVNGEGLEAYLGRAGLYLAKKQAIAALADYEAARGIDKNDPRTHFGLGEARFQQGNYKRATEHFKDARSADGTNPLVYQYLMLSYLALDNEKEVRKSFEKFSQFASPDEMEQLRSNERFAGVLRIVDTN